MNIIKQLRELVENRKTISDQDSAILNEHKLSELCCDNIDALLDVVEAAGKYTSYMDEWWEAQPEDATARDEFFDMLKALQRLEDK